jgi:hypothetical protein
VAGLRKNPKPQTNHPGRALQEEISSPKIYESLANALIPQSASMY